MDAKSRSFGGCSDGMGVLVVERTAGLDMVAP